MNEAWRSRSSLPSSSRRSSAVRGSSGASRVVCRVADSPKAFEALARMKAALLEADGRYTVREVKLERRSLAVVLSAVRRADVDALAAVLAGLADAVLAPGGVTIHGADA